LGEVHAGSIAMATRAGAISRDRGKRSAG
jgi:hypothetical protein